MDEEVVIDLFNRAKGLGYTKSIEDFKVLLSSDSEAISDSFNYVKGRGYQKSIDDFKILIGASSQPEDVKKKTLRNLYRQMVRWNHSLLEIFHTDNMEARICLPLG